MSASDEGDLELPRHVGFDGIEWLIPAPNEGGLGHVARAFGISRRTVQRWKRAGRLPFFSADRALARVNEQPVTYWPEAFGLQVEIGNRSVPAALRPETKIRRAIKPSASWAPSAQPHRLRPKPHPTRLPIGAIEESRTRVMLAMLVASETPPVPITRLIEMVGLSRATVWCHLVWLRKEGLIDWVEGQQGTLHPLVRVVR